MYVLMAFIVATVPEGLVPEGEVPSARDIAN